MSTKYAQCLGGLALIPRMFGARAANVIIVDVSDGNTNPRIRLLRRDGSKK